jgi:hypothetical protein
MSNPADPSVPTDPTSDLKLELACFTEEHLMTAARAKTWGAIQVIPSREVDRLKDLAAQMVRVCFAHAVNPRDFPLLKSSLEVLNPDASIVYSDGQSDGQSDAQIEAQTDHECQNR